MTAPFSRLCASRNLRRIVLVHLVWFSDDPEPEVTNDAEEFIREVGHQHQDLIYRSESTHMKESTTTVAHCNVIYMYSSFAHKSRTKTLQSDTSVWLDFQMHLGR